MMMMRRKRKKKRRRPRKQKPKLHSPKWEGQDSMPTRRTVTFVRKILRGLLLWSTARSNCQTKRKNLWTGVWTRRTDELAMPSGKPRVEEAAVACPGLAYLCNTVRKRWVFRKWRETAAILFYNKFDTKAGKTWRSIRKLRFCIPLSCEFLRHKKFQFWPRGIVSQSTSSVSISSVSISFGAFDETRRC